MYFSEAGCEKGRLPGPHESLSLPPPYLPRHSSSENYLKLTLQEGTVRITCIYILKLALEIHACIYRYIHIHVCILSTYVYLDTFAIWHGGLGWDIWNKM